MRCGACPVVASRPAPTEVAIEGVLHEYSTLDGVREDMVDLLLNLKGVVFKLNGRSEVTLRLAKAGGVVTAGDIEVGHDVGIINPDHVIAHLAPGGKDRDADQGRGRSGLRARQCPP